MIQPYEHETPFSNLKQTKNSKRTSDPHPPPIIIIANSA